MGKIESEVGHPDVLKVSGWNEAMQIAGNGKVRMTKIAGGEFEIALAAGQEIIVAPSPEVQPQLKPVQHSVEEINLYGVKKGMNDEEEMVYPVSEYEY